MVSIFYSYKPISLRAGTRGERHPYNTESAILVFFFAEERLIQPEHVSLGSKTAIGILGITNYFTKDKQKF